MSLEQLQWSLASAGTWVVPTTVALAIFFARWPRPIPVRAVLAIATGWAASVVYMTYVYNPAGIAHGYATNADSPEMRFDNNTIASALLIGWILPAIAVGAAVMVRRIATPRQSRGENGG